jgi:hypothetical protein
MIYHNITDCFQGIARSWKPNLGRSLSNTGPESGWRQHAKRRENLFELEVVDAPDLGIMHSILTKLFWAAFPSALSCSAEFNVLP